MGDQFFTGAGFALNQDRRIGRGDDFDLLERAGERRTLADDLREIEPALNLFFQVDLFAGQLVLQRFDLVEGQRVFNRDGDLTGDLAEQFGVLPAECVVPQTAHGHYSSRAVVGSQKGENARSASQGGYRGRWFV